MVGGLNVQATQVRDLQRSEYELLRDFIYQKCGINLGDHKLQLVQSRLNKRLRQLGLETYKEYYERLVAQKDDEEMTILLDSISTNTTHLFREKHHFDVLVEQLREWTSAKGARRNSTIRIWSAGCSSGEEPYTLAIVATELFRADAPKRVKILATDISTRVLERAEAGRYGEAALAQAPENLRRTYFTKVRGSKQPEYDVSDRLKKLITFKRFNLMSPAFPFRNLFDVIFCRNVMIYFDRETQETLVNKYAKHLAPDGLLFIGHSESLNRISHPLKYVAPTVYRKA